MPVQHDLYLFNMCVSGQSLSGSQLKYIQQNLSLEATQKILKTYGSVMKVENIAECSIKPWECNTFNLHLGKIGLENHFGSSF